VIPETTVKQIFNRLSEYIDVLIIRSDQRGQPPRYPFITYKNINMNNESAHQNYRLVEENSIDPTNSDVVLYEHSDETYSLNFMDKERVDRIKSYSAQVMQWFKSIDGIGFCKARGIVCQLIDNQVQDRTLFLDAYHESRYGFDVRFVYNGAYTQTIEAVEKIDVTPTIDGVEKSDITIQET
jgi:hypothetical protein